MSVLLTMPVIPEFGARDPGCEYIERPGAYAVIFDDDQQHVGLIRTRRGYFLPGGGALPGEMPEETLAREVLEECGFAPVDVQRLGEAVEYVRAASEGQCYRIHGVFFAARPGYAVSVPVAQGEALEWVPAGRASMLLLRASQAWAVRQWREGRGHGNR